MKQHSEVPSLFTEVSRKLIEERLSRMTLRQKVGQLVQLWIRTDEHVVQVEPLVREGRCGSINFRKLDLPLRNRLQRIAVEEAPGGVPVLFGHDVIHGFWTGLPNPVAAACSWNLDLIEEAWAMQAQEALAAGFNWTFGPMLDVARDSRWGRLMEGAGEDALLVARVGAAQCRGLGRDFGQTSPRLAANIKHFVAYGEVESGIDYNTVSVDMRRVHETYLPPFLAALEAGAPTVMTAFHDLNGAPMTAHEPLVRELLRQKWRFDGVIVSDAQAIQELQYFGVAKDRAVCAELAIRTGIDVDMNSGIYLEELEGLVENGRVPESLIDESVRRVLALKYWCRLFEHPYADAEQFQAAIREPQNRNLSRKLARQSAVLLENREELLPLHEDTVDKLAVIGPFADDHEHVLGIWHCVVPEEESVTILDGFRNRLGPDRVLFAPGCRPTDEVPLNVDDSAFHDLGDGPRFFASEQQHDVEGRITAAVEVAKAASVVVLTLGHISRWSGECSWTDTLDLPSHQQRLLEAVAATGKPVVLLLTGGRPISAVWAKKNIPTILHIWQLGSEGGNAVADLLFGDESPSGHLCVTTGRHIATEPNYYNHARMGRYWVRRKYKPLWPFGYGLSYTSFTYDNLQLDKTEVTLEEPLQLTIDITNTGKRPGTTVAQLYLRDEVGSSVRPVKSLRNFQRVDLEPDEKRTLRFTVTAEDCAVVAADGSATLEPGEFTIWVAPNSQVGKELPEEEWSGPGATFLRG